MYVVECSLLTGDPGYLRYITEQGQPIYTRELAEAERYALLRQAQAAARFVPPGLDPVLVRLTEARAD